MINPSVPELDSRAVPRPRYLAKGTLCAMVTAGGGEQGKQGWSAREYLRVSLDRSGRARSVDEQHADHVRVAGERGWTLVAESYRDESVSASRYSRKARGGFDALIEDLERDRFGGQVLMIWESGRGSRRVGDWTYDPAAAGTAAPCWKTRWMGSMSRRRSQRPIGDSE